MGKGLWKLIVHCKYCKQSFLQRTYNQNFCSMGCYRLFQKSGQYTIPGKKKGNVIICIICKKEFYVRKSEIKKRKVCSRNCYLIYHQNPKLPTNCATCGKLLENNKFKFCNRECYLKQHSIKEKVCLECGNNFVPKRTSNRKLCSRECVGKYVGKLESRKQLISIAFRGDKHPNWLGGISKLPYCPIWTDWLKKEIKERDDYKCQNPDCQKEVTRKNSLCVHHIDYNKKKLFH